MNRLERNADLYEAVVAALGGWQSGIWTALPGELVSYDPATETCVVRPTVQMKVSAPDGSFTWVTISQLGDVPVVFPGGGGFTLTFPLVPGDEVLVVLASRCIDGWWSLGGPRPQMEMRMHNLSDGFAIPGPRNRTRVLVGVDEAKAVLRSDDNLLRIELAAGHVCNVVAPGGLNITGPVNVIGDTVFVGQVTANGKRIDETHRHTGVTVGAGNSGVVL